MSKMMNVPRAELAELVGLPPTVDDKTLRRVIDKVLTDQAFCSLVRRPGCTSWLTLSGPGGALCYLRLCQLCHDIRTRRAPL